MYPTLSNALLMSPDLPFLNSKRISRDSLCFHPPRFLSATRINGRDGIPGTPEVPYSCLNATSAICSPFGYRCPLNQPTRTSGASESISCIRLIRFRSAIPTLFLNRVFRKAFITAPFANFRRNKAAILLRAQAQDTAVRMAFGSSSTAIRSYWQEQRRKP